MPKAIGIVLAAILGMFWLAGAVWGAEAPSEEVLRLGQRMYREGILPDGTPMKAVVSGDVAVDGRLFACVKCHRRSGLGSAEGTIVTWPITGTALYQPRRRTGAWRPPDDPDARSAGRRSLPRQHQAPDARPAYTGESLARALREGRDPTGRTLHATMPRYTLSDRDLAILTRYLESLSKQPSPGVDATTLRLGTVVTEGVPAEHRAAMLGMLQAYVDAHNSQYRHEERRAQEGPFAHSEANQRYRRLELDRWDLTGPRESWRGQLEAYARQRPAFALVGGLAAGSWAPIHTFCEDNQIPCLFPLTDLPVVSATDWYTHYFSRGLHLEGAAAITYLQERGALGPGARVVQVFRPGESAAALARGVRETATTLGVGEVLDRPLGPGEALGPRLVTELIDAQRATVLLLWLDAGELEGLRDLAEARPQPEMILLSSTLLGADMARVPDTLRPTVYLTHPYGLPAESKARQSAFRTYLRTRNLPLIDLPIQAKTWFLSVMLSRALRDLRSEFSRDYLLETLEMATDQQTSIAVYPRLTFGPDQRYAAKGCYIVQLTPGPSPKLVKASDWITP